MAFHSDISRVTPFVASVLLLWFNRVCLNLLHALNGGNGMIFTCSHVPVEHLTWDVQKGLSSILGSKLIHFIVQLLIPLCPWQQKKDGSYIYSSLIVFFFFILIIPTLQPLCVLLWFRLVCMLLLFWSPCQQASVLLACLWCKASECGVAGQQQSYWMKGNNIVTNNAEDSKPSCSNRVA